MLNGTGGRQTASLDHLTIQALLRMAEAECSGLLVLILRISGKTNTVRRHGQDAAISWSAAFDPVTAKIALTTTDLFSHVSETYVIEPEVFAQLTAHLSSVSAEYERQYCGRREDVKPASEEA